MKCCCTVPLVDKPQMKNVPASTQNARLGIASLSTDRLIATALLAEAVAGEGHPSAEWAGRFPRASPRKQDMLLQPMIPERTAARQPWWFREPRRSW
jgi:hypothetical protein